MVRTFLFASLAASFLSATPANAALELDPSSDWQLRQYEDKCRMSRKFGQGEDEVTLWVFKASPGRFVNITALGRPFRNPYGSRVAMTFAPGETLSRGFLRSTSSKGRPVLSMFGVEPISSAQEPLDNEVSETGEEDEEAVDLTLGGEFVLASPEVLAKRYDAVEALELSGSLAEKVSLKVGGLQSMMTALDRCNEARMEARRRAQAKAGDSGRGATTSGEREWAVSIQQNYPSYLLREMAQGSVGIRVQINPEGRATFCEVTQYKGSAGFTDAACLGMLRFARFNPTLDAAGSPSWGTYATRITYRVN